MPFFNISNKSDLMLKVYYAKTGTIPWALQSIHSFFLKLSSSISEDSDSINLYQQGLGMQNILSMY